MTCGEIAPRNTCVLGDQGESICSSLVFLWRFGWVIGILVTRSELNLDQGEVLLDLLFTVYADFVILIGICSFRLAWVVELGLDLHICRWIVFPICT